MFEAGKRAHAGCCSCSCQPWLTLIQHARQHAKQQDEHNNSAVRARFAVDVGTRLLGKERFNPDQEVTMGAEDFGFFQQAGTLTLGASYIFLGIGDAVRP